MVEMLQYAVQFRRLYQRYFQEVGEELELSQMEIDMLLFLRNNPELNTARDIVAVRGFAKSNVSAAVERLVGEGWLRVEADRGNRRLKRLVLRSVYEDELERLARCQEACFAAVLEGLREEEVEELRALFARLGGNMRRALGEEE